MTIVYPSLLTVSVPPPLPLGSPVQDGAQSRHPMSVWSTEHWGYGWVWKRSPRVGSTSGSQAKVGMSHVLVLRCSHWEAPEVKSPGAQRQESQSTCHSHNHSSRPKYSGCHQRTQPSYPLTLFTRLPRHPPTAVHLLYLHRKSLLQPGALGSKPREGGLFS